MKYTYQLCTLIVFSFLILSAHAQNEKSITISANYAMLPVTKMQGTGYALAYQQSINDSYFFKAKYGYAQGWKENMASEISDENYQLFPTHYNHAGFHLSMQAGYQLNIAKPIHINFSIGPAISYQSTLLERTNYHYESISYAKTTINENFQEGLFLGGTASLVLVFQINHKWSILAEESISSYFKAQTIINTGLGFRYSF